jgi:hypothetical protein
MVDPVGVRKLVYLMTDSEKAREGRFDVFRGKLFVVGVFEVDGCVEAPCKFWGIGHVGEDTVFCIYIPYFDLFRSIFAECVEEKLRHFHLVGLCGEVVDADR